MAAAARAQTNAVLPSPTASCSYPSVDQPGCRDVVGFRAPYFKLNGALGAALQDSGFLWDSSISGKDPRQPAAPMHAFNLSACAAVGCGNWSGLSIWCGGPAGCCRGLRAAAAAKLWAPHVCTGRGAYIRVCCCTCDIEQHLPAAACARREVPAYTLPGKGGQAFRRVDPAPLPGMPVLEAGGGLAPAGRELGRWASSCGCSGAGRSWGI